MKNYVFFNLKNFLTSLIIVITIFYLNEFLFYNIKYSFYINLFIFFMLLIYFFINKLNAFFISMLIIFLINTRPREIHLLPLEIRGSFDYHSFNIMKLGFFTFSTDLIILFSIFILIIVLRNKRINYFNNMYNLFFVFIIGFISAFLSTLNTSEFYLRSFITDLRFFVLLVLGNLTFIVIEKYYDVALIIKKFLNFIVILFLSNLFLTVLNIAYDFINNFFKLQYSINTMYINYILFFILLMSYEKFKSNLLLFMGFLLMIPLTRGEQLNLFLVFVLSVYVFFKIRNRLTYEQYLIVIIRYAVLIFLLITSIYLLYLFSPKSYSFLMHKLSFFTNISNISQSASVRVSEFKQIFNIGSIYNFVKLLFGSGFGGFFSYNDDYIYNLTLAAYSAKELTTNRIFNTHSFLSFFILKIGIFGFIFILIYFIKPLKGMFISRRNYGINILYLLALPFFLYYAYWSPSVAYYAGFFNGLIYVVNRKRGCYE